MCHRGPSRNVNADAFFLFFFLYLITFLFQICQRVLSISCYSNRTGNILVGGAIHHVKPIYLCACGNIYIYKLYTGLSWELGRWVVGWIACSAIISALHYVSKRIEAKYSAHSRYPFCT